MLRSNAARSRALPLGWSLRSTLYASLLTAACSGAGPEAVDPPAQDPGQTVDPGPQSPTTQAELARIGAEIEASENFTPADIANRYALTLESDVPYDGTTATNLDIIQESALGLSTDELGILADKGFVISARTQFPSFLYGYEALYGQDLPLYVSADSILHAVHRSYDKILQAVELASLIPDLKAFLTTLRANLQAGAASELGANAEADVDLFLAVALSALSGEGQAPVQGGDAAMVNRLVQKVNAADGSEVIELFGSVRRLDFSQFKPRGHYTDLPELEQYFRAMMWLGRIDFRIIETQPDLTQVFHRQQLEGALAIHALTDAEARNRWNRIDAAIGAFVGEHDSMTLNDVTDMLNDLGVSSLSELKDMEDAEIAEMVIEGGYGTQRISSHYMVNGKRAGTMPLNQSFLVMGQRYVLDSHVFSNVVYDRVQGGSAFRMMPNPLDVAFAALGNDQAAQLLNEELEQYNYAPDLHLMRFLADDHGTEYWRSNLYNLWMSALRALSPDADEVNDPAAHGLPAVAGTEGFGRRILNTQLASWAELRHDTILYAKQSYTGGVTCEFPDAYVDPYPNFYAALIQFAESGQSIIDSLDWNESAWLATRVQEFFTNLHSVASTLKEMAEFQRQGQPFTADHMAFINEAVHIHQGCGAPAGAEGWYARLFYNPAEGAELDPTIADVHTQPTDEFGSEVGRVLHVGTGLPRLMVVSVDTCQGVRAYAGLASSYYEHVTEGWQRLTDDEWAVELNRTVVPDVPWMTDLIAY